MADKSIKTEVKDYTLLKPLRRGSKKNGDPKKVYKKGDSISLTDKDAQVYLKLKLI